MKAGIECYTSKETISHLDLSGHRLNVISHQKLFTLGSFKIVPFDVPHNLPCLGFLISHPESGKILFATDCAYIPHKFKKLSHLMLEMNFEDSIMVNDRAVGHHLSLDTGIEFLKANDMTFVQNIILLHLSAGNSNAKDFAREVSETVPGASVYIGDKNLEVDLNRFPF